MGFDIADVHVDSLMRSSTGWGYTLSALKNSTADSACDSEPERGQQLPSTPLTDHIPSRASLSASATCSWKYASDASGVTGGSSF
jgi:hypothetical protein